MMKALILSTLFFFLGVSYSMADVSVPSKPDETAASFFCPVQENSSVWSKLLDPTSGAQKTSTCGGFTCAPSEVCIFCGSGSWCRPQGDKCCYPAWCSAGQACVICGNFKNCYAAGSTCCDGIYNTICRPDQKCDITTKICVPR